jgi:anti-anti-sigma regulatory factor
MVHSVAVLPEAAGRRVVTIDLIGDLDATLASLFTETLARVSARGDDVAVNFKHVAVVHSDGFAELSKAIAAARLGGTGVAILAKNRRIKTLFTSARIPCEEMAEGRIFVRHVMIARHASA